MLTGSICVLTVAACGGGGGGSADAPPRIDAPASQPDAPTADAGPDAGPDAVPATSCPTADGFTVYLNRDGGSYTVGNDDPATNMTTIFTNPTALPPWPHGNWDQVVACVRAAMAPFNVQIVETEPASGSYSELVFTTTDPETAGVLAVAPSACEATATPHLAFVFGTAIGTDPLDACQFAMFDVGILTGLDFTVDQCDYMTFTDGCATNERWVNADVMCGQTSPALCRCTNDPTQNSVATLTAFYGACP